MSTLATPSYVPSDFGLPSKFKLYRPKQLEYLEQLVEVESTKRFNVGCLPTGFGKTPTYMSYTRMLNETLRKELGRNVRAVILTSTKALQDQIAGEFESMGLHDVRGRNNYRCDDRHTDCANGVERGCSAAFTRNCPYTDTVEDATQGEITSTNYSWWLHARNRNGGQNLALETENRPIDLLILDECHRAFQELAQYLEIRIPEQYCTYLPSITSAVLDTPDALSQWKLWAGVKDYELKGKQNKIRDAYPSDERVARAQPWKLDPGWLELQKVRDNLDRVSKLNANWVVTIREPRRLDNRYGNPSVHFECIWPGMYASNIWSGVQRILMVSGTVRPYTLTLLGLKSVDYNYVSMPSSFPANRNPIYHIPTVKLNWRSTDDDYETLFKQTDAIIASRGDRKGIIHSVSYGRAKRFIESSRFRDRIFFNENGSDAKKTADLFRRSSKAAVLVSPSYGTGWDFEGISAEYQVILKVPYPDTTSLVMKERCKKGAYQMYSTVMDFVQYCGRNMRHDQDRGETFILDNNIGYIRMAGSHFAPKGFFNAPRFRVVKDVPKAPPKL